MGEKQELPLEEIRELKAAFDVVDRRGFGQRWGKRTAQ